METVQQIVITAGFNNRKLLNSVESGHGCRGNCIGVCTLVCDLINVLRAVARGWPKLIESLCQGKFLRDVNFCYPTYNIFFYLVDPFRRCFNLEKVSVLNIF